MHQGPLSPFVLTCALLANHAAAGEAVNLARSEAHAPRLSVSSTFRGYGMDVLTDGTWVALEHQVTAEFTDADRLGNRGNTWVSAEQPGAEQWVRLDWPEPVTVNHVVLWWSLPEWNPRAFRVEWLSDESWVSTTGPDSWLTPTDQCTEVIFAPVQTRALRVVQHERGHGDRALMAAQEVGVYHLPDAAPGLQGAREMTPEETRRIRAVALEPNVARLHVNQPGAVRAVAWTDDPAPVEMPGLSDGDTGGPAQVPPGARAVGFQWAREHVVDSVALIYPDGLPARTPTGLETSTGGGWLPVTTNLQVERRAEERRVVFSFEPVAATMLRIPLDEPDQAPAEVEVLRYLPEGPDVWPARLVEDNQYERELLASGREPSLDELFSVALSMTPAHALLGLKDLLREVGVTWDGSLVGTDTLEFSFGPERETLAENPDTVHRVLVDGWRPGTIVTGRLGSIQVRQTAFVSLAGQEGSHPALFVRWELTNLSGDDLETTVQARMRPRTAGPVSFADGVLMRGHRLALASQPAAQQGATPDALAVPVSLSAGETATVDLVAPHGDPAQVGQAQVYRSTGFDAALDTFRRYWDDLLAPAATLDLPEDHLNKAYRAILAQLFINADGDVMPYGADPSAYAGNLYGVEEAYAMFALAYAGFKADAARYMDGTYLTPEFLAKVPEYRVYAHRHQQYRNGLQPHYAISLYRLTGDREWMEGHRDLLVECAEWTIQERRKTMELVEGERPLHWGLLPEWSYGGDIAGLQCYALYANFACWRGLADTAWLMEELGETALAERYAAEAQDYRECIDRAVEGNLQRDRQPPFLPLQLYATDPVGHDYDQLFYGLVLDIFALDLHTGQVDLITDYMEQENLAFCLMPRFRRDAGAGGIDGIYGVGYVLTMLHQDRIDDFLLGLYGYAAFNLERGTFASRETNLIYASDLHRQSKYRVPDMSDPLPCSSAVFVLYLRHMLVTEALSGPGIPTGDLLLLHGTPRAWFADGRTFSFQGMPTHFGRVSCEVTSAAGQGRIEAVVHTPQRNPGNRIHLRLRHPEGAPMRAVTVNGEAWEQFDPDRETIILPPGAGEVRVVAEF